MFRVILSTLVSLSLFASCEFQKKQTQKVSTSSVTSYSGDFFKITVDPLKEYKSESLIEVKSLFNQNSSLDTFFLKILNQARYWEPEVVNKGPYKVFLSHPNNPKKPLHIIVDSKVINKSGELVNRVSFWLQVNDEGLPFKGVVDIYLEDQTNNKFGKWVMKIWNLKDVNEVVYMASAPKSSEESLLVYNIEYKKDILAGGLYFANNKFSGYYDFSGETHSKQVVKNSSHLYFKDSSENETCYDLSHYTDYPDTYDLYRKSKKINLLTEKYFIHENEVYYLTRDQNEGKQILKNRMSESVEIGSVLSDYNFPKIKTTYKSLNKSKGQLKRVAQRELAIDKEELKNKVFKISNSTQNEKKYLRLKKDPSITWELCQKKYIKDHVELRDYLYYNQSYPY